MSKLLVKPSKSDQNGKIIDITPALAGWEYIGFQVYEIKKGRTISENTGDNEVCLVLLSGKANVKTQLEEFNDIGERMDVFEKIPPYSVYIPNEDNYVVEALTDVMIAVCKAPGKGSFPARLIVPNQVGQEDRGSGKMSRKIHNILPEDEAADSLLVVEVYTPDGNTSSYPPHKHDTLNLPEESLLEETYYHMIHPEQGFVFQRIYNDDRSLDETISVENKNVVLVPEGYHPVSSIPGYESYYLNVMAGPKRTWKFQNDLDHEWLFDKEL